METDALTPVIGKREVRVPEVTIRGFVPPGGAGLVEKMAQARDRRFPGKPDFVDELGDAQPVRDDVRLGAPARMVMIVVPIGPVTTQARGAHAAVSAVAVHK